MVGTMKFSKQRRCIIPWTRSKSTHTLYEFMATLFSRQRWECSLVIHTECGGRGPVLTTSPVSTSPTSATASSVTTAPAPAATLRTLEMGIDLDEYLFLFL